MRKLCASLHRPKGACLDTPVSRRAPGWLRCFALVASLMLILTVLPGCWDYESINRRASLIGIGIDPVPDDPEQIELTIQYPLLSTQSDGGGASEAAISFQALSAKGYSFEEVLRRLQQQMDRKVDLAQLQGIVFSAKLNPDLMDAMVAQIVRHPQLNLLTFVFVTPDSARRLLESSLTGGSPVGTLARLMSIRQHGYAVRVQMWQYWRDETQLGVNPMLPVVVLRPAGGRKGEAGGKGEDVDTVELNGTMAYRHNEPVLYLDPEETFMLNLARGKVRDMSFDFRTKEGVVNLLELRAKSKMRTEGEGKQLKLINQVSVVATLGKVPNPQLKPIPPSNVNAVESASSQYLSEEILQMIEKLQGSGVDVIGFGRKYLQSHPEDEASLRQNWQTMFSSAKVQVQVKVRVISKGELI